MATRLTTERANRRVLKADSPADLAPGVVGHPHVDGAAAQQAELEKSPTYWKRLYLGMVEREEERKRNLEMTRSIVIVTALAGIVLLALKCFFHW